MDRRSLNLHFQAIIGAIGTMAMGGLIFNELQSIQERVSKIESDVIEDRAERPELGILSDIVNSQVSNLMNLESEVATLSTRQSSICSTVSTHFSDVHYQHQYLHSHQVLLNFEI